PSWRASRSSSRTLGRCPRRRSAAGPPNLPGDPDNVSRDDLVFADGSIHIISTIVDASFSVNPRSCIVSFSVQQTGGRFAAASASYTGTVTGRGLAGRNPDGSCSVEQAAL